LASTKLTVVASPISVETLLVDRLSDGDVGVVCDLADAQMVVEQDLATRLLLHHAVANGGRNETEILA
jgi:hypothetical protein